MTIDHLLDPLTHAARSAIAIDVWARPRSALRAPRKEAEYVSILIETFVGPLALAWENILDGTGVNLIVHGAFLHQRPKVRFPCGAGAALGAHHCEIADLLIVHDHNQTTRQACLIQAKKIPGDPVKGDQKRLYETWPPLAFAVGLGGRRVAPPVYDVAPNRNGGWYGVIRTSPPPLEEPWIMEHPLGATQSRDLGLFVAEMLTATIAARSGPARSADIAGGDDWSDLVNALLAKSLRSTYPLKDFWPDRVGRIYASRLIGWREFSGGWEGVSTIYEDIMPYGSRGDGGGGRERLDAEEPPEGLGVIYITTSRDPDLE